MRLLILGSEASGAVRRAHILVESSHDALPATTDHPDPAGSDSANVIPAGETSGESGGESSSGTSGVLELAATEHGADLPTALAEALEQHTGVVLTDLDSWLSTLLASSEHTDTARDALLSVIRESSSSSTVAVVLPETGSALLSSTAPSERTQGNAPSSTELSAAVAHLADDLANCCDRVELVIAGRSLVLSPQVPDAGPGEAGMAPRSTGHATPADAADTDPGDEAAPTSETTPPNETTRTDGEPGNETFADAASFPRITRPDNSARRDAEAATLWDGVPLSRLGHLGEVATWLAATAGTCPPPVPAHPRLTIVAGAHDCADRGITTTTPETAARRLKALTSGHASVCRVAADAGIDVTVVDLEADFGAAGDLTEGRALSHDDALRALAMGRRLAAADIEGGADLLLVSSVGRGASTPAAALIGALTDTEPVVVASRGSGISDAALMTKYEVVRDAMFRVRHDLAEPVQLLARCSGADFCVIVGYLAEAAVRTTPCIVDGLPAIAAGLAAEECAPGTGEWWMAATASTDEAQSIALNQLGTTPILGDTIDAGEGWGAVAVLPLLRTAAGAFPADAD